MDLEKNIKGKGGVKISISDPNIAPEIMPLGNNRVEAPDRVGIKSCLHNALKDKAHKEVSNVLQPITNKIKQNSVDPIS